MSGKKLLLPAVLLIGMHTTAQKSKSSDSFTSVDSNSFQDASHHWYDIAEKDAVIHPLPGRPKYRATELKAIADNILLYQKENGGWPKNYDMMAILSDRQKDTLLGAKSALNTTFDNRTTYTQIACLSQVYYVLRDEKYKAAALKGLQFLLSAQYDNGGWPQYFPLEAGYSRHITFNDDAMGGVMWLLKDIIDGKIQYGFIDENLKLRLKKAFDKGLECILKTQINDTGKPTAWCQQYDEVTLQPAWARTFEPPSICNSESVNLVLLLMSIQKPNKTIITAVDNAVDWFKASKIKGIRVKTIPAPEMVTKYTISRHDRIVVTDTAAPPIWTRYYELKSHRPLFCNREYKIVYTLAEVDRERRDGYGWYTYEPQKVLNRYAAWKKKLR